MKRFLDTRFGRSLTRFRAARAGVAAVEFALILPAMLSIWIGMVVLTDMLSADRKVTVLTRTLSDLATQFTTVGQSDLDSIFNATGQIIWPAPPKELGMRLTSITIDGAGVAFVDWSSVPSDSNLKGTYSALGRCSKVTDVPAGLMIPRTSVVLAESTMVYNASVATEIVDQIFGGVFSGGKTGLSDKLYMRPRQVSKVAFSPPPLAECPGFVP